MTGPDSGHTRQQRSSPTLPSSIPIDVPPMVALNDEATGEPVLEEYASDRLSQIDFTDSRKAYEGRGKTDSVTQGDGFEHNTTQKRFSTDNLNRFSIDELTSYDLHPPPPLFSDSNAEHLASKLFSEDHFDLILKSPQHFQRFRCYLNRYHPQSAHTLVRYLESQKALAAIRYANALANTVSSTRDSESSQVSRSSSVRSNAAVVDTHFQDFSRKAVDELVTDALPAYITYRMITLVTECLVKDITGTNTPFMRDLVQGLAEVYCISDPNQPDNPLVFASEEFYNTTQYNNDYVIGKNCRFLQGPNTSRAAVKRISKALRNGKEISEILLNYRRDGNPFLNLAMMAPLMDQRGNIRYYIGAQIDITRLLEGGKGLDSFKQLLDQEQESTNKATMPDLAETKPSLKILHELGGLLNEEEADVVRQCSGHVRRGSMSSTASTPARPSTWLGRRFIGMEDEDSDSNMWPPSEFGPSGRLPGVYQNYLLVRPYPSLRIIFTSPALRIPGLSQSKFMDRIGGPQYVREALQEALARGTSVTAKVSWLTQSPKPNKTTDSASDASTSTPDPRSYLESRPRWIHCTPLLGSDSKPGVYMIVMVDKEEITGTLNARHTPVPVIRSRDLTKDAWHSHGVDISENSAAHFSSTKLYTDYLKREGIIGNASDSPSTRRRLPHPSNRNSLEEDFRLGKVNYGIARGNPRAEIASSEGMSHVSGMGRLQSRGGLGLEEELSAPHHHPRNVSLGVGQPTPYIKRSTATELDMGD